MVDEKERKFSNGSGHLACGI